MSFDEEDQVFLDKFIQDFKGACISFNMVRHHSDSGKMWEAFFTELWESRGFVEFEQKYAGIILIPQVMLAGAVAKIPNAVVEMLSYLTLSRWGNEGFSFIQGDVLMQAPDMKKAIELANQGKEGIPIHDVKVNAAEELQKGFHMETFESLFGQASNSLKLDAAIVVTMALLFFVGIYISLKMKDSIKIR